jgi:hypothetical protein
MNGATVTDDHGVDHDCPRELQGKYTELDGNHMTGFQQDTHFSYEQVTDFSNPLPEKVATLKPFQYVCFMPKIYNSGFGNGSMSQSMFDLNIHEVDPKFGVNALTWKDEFDGDANSNYWCYNMENNKATYDHYLGNRYYQITHYQWLETATPYATGAIHIHTENVTVQNYLDLTSMYSKFPLPYMETPANDSNSSVGELQTAFYVTYLQQQLKLVVSLEESINSYIILIEYEKAKKQDDEADLLYKIQCELDDLAMIELEAQYQIYTVTRNLTAWAQLGYFSELVVLMSCFTTNSAAMQRRNFNAGQSANAEEKEQELLVLNEILVDMKSADPVLAQLTFDQLVERMMLGLDYGGGDLVDMTLVDLCVVHSIYSNADEYFDELGATCVGLGKYECLIWLCEISGDMENVLIEVEAMNEMVDVDDIMSGLMDGIMY